MEKVYKTIGDDLLEKIENVTDIDYEYKQDYIPKEIIDMLKDLVVEYDKLKEEYEDYKEDTERTIQDDYNLKSPYEMYGVSKNDFN